MNQAKLAGGRRIRQNRRVLKQLLKTLLKIITLIWYKP